jgi:serine/threonine protein kinase
MQQQNQIIPSTTPQDPVQPQSRQKRSDPLIGHTFFNKYVLKRKLGEGSFGKIYQGDYNNEKFALKLESRQRGQSLLEAEAYIMNYLKGRKPI